MIKRQKIFFCTDGVFPHAIGGMQRHTALLLEELGKINDADYFVIHPHDKNVFDPKFGIAEFPLNYKFEGNYMKACYDYSKLIYNILKEKQPDVIYCQGFSVWYGLKEFASRLIVNPHGLEPFQTHNLTSKIKTAPMRMLERYQFKHAAKVVSLGGRLTDILKEETTNPRKQIVVLPNAVNITPKVKRSFDKEVLQLLFVGRFAFNKGINILMGAVKELNNEGYKNRLHFNIVGKGPLYEQYVKEYDFSNVTFVGFADDDKLAALYRENDLFVFPTLFEGMPTVVLEAMMGGMPIVVSDTGATCELVNSQNGYLIESNNVRSLKWGIQSFYQLTPSERLELSEASYSRVMEKFTWPAVAQKHIELFNSFRNSV